LQKAETFLVEKKEYKYSLKENVSFVILNINFFNSLSERGANFPLFMWSSKEKK